MLALDPGRVVLDRIHRLLGSVVTGRPPSGKLRETQPWEVVVAIHRVLHTDLALPVHASARRVTILVESVCTERKVIDQVRSDRVVMGHPVAGSFELRHLPRIERLRQSRRSVRQSRFIVGPVHKESDPLLRPNVLIDLDAGLVSRIRYAAALRYVVITDIADRPRHQSGHCRLHHLSIRQHLFSKSTKAAHRHLIVRKHVPHKPAAHLSRSARIVNHQFLARLIDKIREVAIVHLRRWH